jgi:hypothetical protein
MIRYHFDIEQGSEEWHALRCGIPDGQRDAADRSRRRSSRPATTRSAPTSLNCSGSASLGYTEPSIHRRRHALRGHEDEVEARIRYAENFAPVTECGFVTNDDHGFVIGYSPDGLVDYDGLIECKSRRQKYQVETILADRVPEEYMLQIQTGLLVTGREWLDFVSYCAGLPMFVKRVFPDARYQEAIIAAAIGFEYRLQIAQEKYAAWLDRQPVVINTVRTIQEEITC